jgi:uncharacterized membrane protein
MAHKGATQQQNSGRRRGESTPPRARSQASAARTNGLERALWILIALSAAIALVQLYIHAQLAATRGSYTSFCNVSSTVNCDAVLMSPYGMLLGIPVAAWGFLSYLALAFLLFRRRRAVGAARIQTVLLALGLALWNVGVALYMAAISTFAIGALCLLCAGTYLLVATTAVLMWSLASIDLGVRGEPVVIPARALAGAAITVGVAAIAAVQCDCPVSGTSMTADQVKTRDPEFYDWYTKRPITKDLPPGRQQGPRRRASDHHRVLRLRMPGLRHGVSRSSRARRAPSRARPHRVSPLPALIGLQSERTDAHASFGVPGGDRLRMRRPRRQVLAVPRPALHGTGSPRARGSDRQGRRSRHARRRVHGMPRRP